MTNLSQFNSFLPSTLGFDRIFDALERTQTTPSYPPANVIRLDDNNYLIELAIAGYSESDVEVTSERNRLTITGAKKDVSDRDYLIKGISSRAFERSFVLADTIVIRDVELENGILSIKLENVIPEDLKPRKIPILKKALE